ncbi:MAG: phage tail sheath family protein [Acetobacteraceae bacterium]|nr:phage tail sheath family protein [Acetobacteraceae bacterium]
MPYPELVVRDARRPAAGLSSRADVALFVGLVGRRPGPVPPLLLAELEAAGWAGSGPFTRGAAATEALLDMPVALDSFDAFDALFAWDQRPVALGDPRRLPCPLGLAVRSFFAEGGIRAVVVRTGDPLPLLSDDGPDAAAAARRRLLSWAPADAPPDAAARVPLLSGLAGRGNRAEATDPRTWHGAAHVFGVEEAAMLLLPDLPELVAGAPVPIPDLPAAPPPPEQFKPCAQPAPDYIPDPRLSRPAVGAPRLDRARYGDWASAIRFVLDLLSPVRTVAQRRDVMLLASLPLPSRRTGAVPRDAEGWPLAILDDAAVPGGALFAGTRIGSARLQLAYPWVETADSGNLPEGVAPPEGVLAGALAGSALRLGAFRSAAGTPLASVRDCLPTLATSALRRGLPGNASDWLGDRLSLIGPAPSGMALLSDATASTDRAWRAGGVSRLMGVLLRAARQLGQQRIFDNSGPALWAALAEELEAFMQRLRDGGALAGATPGEAFAVRCDASTMTQADLDAGRVIATVAFTAAQPIQRITVTLALGNSGGPPVARAA